MDITQEDTAGYRIEPVNGWDIDPALNLRDLDQKEILHCHSSVCYGLFKTVMMSAESYVVSIDGKQEALFGVSQAGCIWFVSSDVIFEKYLGTFMSKTKDILDFWLKKYGRLSNRTLTENTRSIKWLKSLGFQTENQGTWTYFRKEDI